jgi:4-amino-4-deoxy-L-arabinose transferase-like glycosyltransferase
MRQTRLAPRLVRAYAAALATTLLAAVIVALWERDKRGLRLEIYPERDFSGRPTVLNSVRGVDLEETGLARRRGSARWSGALRVREAGRYDLQLRADDHAILRLDGQLSLERKADSRSRGARGSVFLEAGFHALEVDCARVEPEHVVRLRWGRTGEPLERIGEDDLHPAVPDPVHARLLDLARVFRRALLALWLAPPLLAAAAACRRRVRDGRWPLREWGLALEDRPALLRVVLPLLIVSYAGALRFEAVVDRYWGDGPGWALRARSLIRPLHPAALRWHPAPPYEGDPYSYLRAAREMERFYDARVREPLYVFATRVFLAWSGDRDVGVSFASAFFSTLAVLATYLTGAQAFSAFVGLGAAAAFAVERQVIGFGAEGWRDDAFACCCLLSAWGLLRLQREASATNGILAGLSAAGACLTRITALSFLLPAFAWLALGASAGARAARLRAVGLSLALLLLLVAPYLINCALVFGDPLYPINSHTGFYRARAGLAHEGRMGWWDFLWTSFGPYRLADNLLVGLTSHPFANKWGQFDYLSPLLGPTLEWAALLGGLVCLASPSGRLLLLVLFTSLLPFAFTWDVSGGGEWRFTLHAYPFYLVAGFAAFEAAARFLVRARYREMRFGRIAPRAAALLGAGLALWIAAAWLNYKRTEESIAAGREATVFVGPRDRAFFTEGWYAPLRRGNVRVRFSRGPRAVMRLPLRAGRSYALRLRLDPVPLAGAPPTVARVLLNGVAVAELSLEWDERRIGSYEALLPRESLRDGDNRLELVADRSTLTRSVQPETEGIPAGWDTAFQVWYIQLSPS